MRTIVRNMDDVEFIREQIRAYLSEEKGKETVTGRASRSAVALSGRAAERPKEVLTAFGLTNFIPTGSTNIEKAASILKFLRNSDRAIGATVDKFEVVGNEIHVYPKMIEIAEEGTTRALIPVGRLAIYTKTLCIACWKGGKIEMEYATGKQVKDQYGIVRGFK